MSNLTALDAVDLFMSVCDSPNISDTDITSELWVLQDRASGIIHAVILLIYFLVGVPLNTTVLGIVFWKRLYKQQPTTILLLNLVINDLIILVLLVPLQISTGLSGEYLFGNSDKVRCSVCKTGLLSSGFLLVSVFTITVISLDRFLFLCKPLRYNKIVTPLRTLLVLAVVWLVSIIIALPPAFGFGSVVFFQPFLSCVTNFFTSHFIIFFVILSVPLVTLIVCNVGVIYIVLKNIRAVYKVEKSRSTDPQTRSEEEALAKEMKKKRHQKQVHFVYVYGGLMCSTIFAMLPLAIFSLVVVITSFLSVEIEASNFVHVTFYSQVCVHPILETWLVKEVREPIRELFSHARTKLHLDFPCNSRVERGKVFSKCSCHCCKDSHQVKGCVKRLHFLGDLVHGALVHGDASTLETVEVKAANNDSDYNTSSRQS